MDEEYNPKRYIPSTDDFERLFNNFRYHPPKPGQANRYDAIRIEARSFAEYLLKICPPSRELSLALTELESAVMWAIVSITHNE